MLTCANELGVRASTTRTASRPNINLDLNFICSPFEVVHKSNSNIDHQRAVVLPAGHEIQTVLTDSYQHATGEIRWRQNLIGGSTLLLRSAKRLGNHLLLNR